jgi:hypothetical protein
VLTVAYVGGCRSSGVQHSQVQIVKENENGEKRTILLLLLSFAIFHIVVTLASIFMKFISV